MRVYLAVTLGAAGAIAQRAATRPAVSLIGGIATGGLSTATFVAISPAYHPDPGLTIYMTAASAPFAPIGSALASQATVAWTIVRRK